MADIARHPNTLVPVAIDSVTGLPIALTVVAGVLQTSGSGGGGGGSAAGVPFTTFIVTNAFTGASVGDIITEAQVFSVGLTPTYLYTVWHNQTTGLDLAGAPSFANIALSDTTLPIGAATSALQTTGNTSLSTIATNTTGASTAALQTTGNTSLASIDTKLPTQGQAAAAASVPVTLSNEDVQDLNFIGQSGQINTINNILTVVAGAAAIDANGYRSGTIELGTSGSVTGGAMLLECSNDNAIFYAIPYVNQSASQNAPAALSSSAINPSFSIGNAIITFNIPGRYIRLRISSAITGGGSIQAFSRFSQIPYSSILVQTFIASGQSAHSAAIAGNPVRVGGAVTSTLDTTLVNGDTSNVMMTTAGQTIIKAFGSAENDWTYAAASGGIVNTTTAVTIKSAGAASIRNYITGIDVTTDGSLGAATELAIRDGAAGTVLWRIKIPTTGLATQSIKFPTPLKGTAATLLEVVTLTASITGAVYFNAQGYQSF